ncbi:MAG: XRE family transcriptional regulator [Chloroflexota bacterium]
MNRKKFSELRARTVRTPESEARVAAYKAAMRDVLAIEELRAGRKLTQGQVARALGASQANVSQIEHQDNIYLKTLSSYIEALGGHLEVRVIFPDETVVLALPGVPAG